MNGARPPSRRSLLALVAGGSVAVLANGLATGCARETPEQSAAPPVPSPPSIQPAGLPRPPATDDVVVAQAIGPGVTVFDAPGGTLVGTVPNPTANGAPAVFLVLDRQPGWTRAYLPVRQPNVGWIPAEQVACSRHSYRLVVELSRHRVVLFRGGEVLRVERAGIGTVNSPTPPGTYYTTELLQPPDPEGFYGPFAYGLNGYNGAPADRNGLNDQMGLHGTNDPTTLGRDVSLGCVRVSNEAIRAMAAILPLGVPVVIS